MKLNNVLLPHQKIGVEKLIRLKVGALFMEQGTGKTITTLEMARIRYESGKIDSVIWLCPCSAKGNIHAEIVRHCPTKLRKIFTICGIETMSTSIRAISYLLSIADSHKCFLVVDESLLIKNPKAYRTEHILKIAAKCPYRIILNGTPVSRNEADLFSQFFLLDWRILGYKSYWSFSANHLEFDDYGRLRRVLNTDYLAEKIAPYTYQIKKQECISLPAKSYSSHGFSLTSRQNAEYNRVADVLLEQVDEWKSETIYRLFSGLQAVISGKSLVFNKNGSHFETFEMFNDPRDNPRIQALINIIPDDDKTIIFCRYESEISQLCSILDGSVRFDGTIPVRKRDAVLREFAEDKKYLIANRTCAGFSLNLQFCHNIIYLSNDWDLGTRLQSEDRVHRLGQEYPVSITDIFAWDTIDEKILNCLSNKEHLLDSLKTEIDQSGGGVKAAMKKYIYGSRYQKEVFDCSELEDDDAKNISKQKCL